MRCSVLDLVHDLKDILDLKAPRVMFDAGTSDSKESDEGLDRPSPSNSSYQKAKDEVGYLDKFKRKKYHPIMIGATLISHRKKNSILKFGPSMLV